MSIKQKFSPMFVNQSNQDWLNQYKNKKIIHKSKWTVTIYSLTDYSIKSCLSCKSFHDGPTRQKMHFSNFECSDWIEIFMEFRFDRVEKRYQWKKSDFLFFIELITKILKYFLRTLFEPKSISLSRCIRMNRIENEIKLKTLSRLWKK
jgi:hypothetical protein